MTQCFVLWYVMEGWRLFPIKLSTEPLQALRFVVVVIVLRRRRE